MRARCLLLLMLLGCGDADRPLADAAADATPDLPGVDAAPPPEDAGPDLGMECARGTTATELAREPVDIIFLVDNSGSMEDAIRNVREGLNGFAERITTSGLDYRILMISQRGTGTTDICIPEPLAGDARCGDGERFFHIDVDLRSTQILEQVLGTLGQTQGFREGDSRGGRSWSGLLRSGATKAFVVVSDDDQRVGIDGSPAFAGRTPLARTSLEDYPGGPHPFQQSNELGPGILTETYGDLFVGYVFHGIYGADPVDPTRTCGPVAASPGTTYTTLVERTGGVRASICDQASSAAWDTFFDTVAGEVRDQAEVACEILIPPPPEGLMLDPARVNVFLRTSSGDTLIRKAAARATADDCGINGGWYYDDEAEPTEVRLCPVTCAGVQEVLSTEGMAEVIVELGCQSELI